MHCGDRLLHHSGVAYKLVRKYQRRSGDEGAPLHFLLAVVNGRVRTNIYI